ncbi:MAG: lamin tail domain-containing protein [Actinomycetota bacterium]
MRYSFFLLFVAFLGAACAGNSATPAETAGTRVAVKYVIDGDSMEVTVNGASEEVRLLGINAPEGDECFGDKAREALIGFTDGDEAVLIADANTDTDRYGRLLRYAFVDGENVNKRLLAHGYAVALQGEHERNAEFVETARVAADTRLGMWAPDACGPPPPDGIEITAVDYNPPGPDDERLNDESVTIENTRSKQVNLSGWTLRDESSQNRYELRGVNLKPGERITIHTGCDKDDRDSVYWCSDTPIWSNGGDTAILQDRHGNVVDWWMYLP